MRRTRICSLRAASAVPDIPLAPPCWIWMEATRTSNRRRAEVHEPTATLLSFVFLQCRFSTGFAKIHIHKPVEDDCVPGAIETDVDTFRRENLKISADDVVSDEFR